MPCGFLCFLLAQIIIHHRQISPHAHFHGLLLPAKARMVVHIPLAALIPGQQEEIRSGGAGCIHVVTENVTAQIIRTDLHGGPAQLSPPFSRTPTSIWSGGIYDLAFITLQDYTQPLPARTQIRPAYAEAFVVATYRELPNENGFITTGSMKEEKEIYVAWNKEFKAWHTDHFDEQISLYVFLEHSGNKKLTVIRRFLDLLDRRLGSMPEDKVQLFLG